MSSKILEHIIHKHIVDFLGQRQFFTPVQHSFRKGVCTVTQLVETIHCLAATINSRGQSDVIFLDLSKAFDRVPYCKLILKLKSLVYNDKLVTWFCDYNLVFLKGLC